MFRFSTPARPPLNIDMVNPLRQEPSRNRVKRKDGATLKAETIATTETLRLT